MQNDVLTEAQREKRRKKNRKRVEQRKRAKARAALPPVIGLSRAEFRQMFGPDVDYEAYAETFIAGVKAQGRRVEFPPEPLRGVSFPSRIKWRKGSCSGE